MLIVFDLPVLLPSRRDAKYSANNVSNLDVFFAMEMFGIEYSNGTHCAISRGGCVLKKHNQVQLNNQTPTKEGVCIEGVILGFYIGGRIFYSLEKKKFVDIDEGGNSITLRSTMAFLFEYLLINGQGGIVTDNELMVYVWEANGLRSSRQRLWQVMDRLKTLLNQMGVDNIIMRVNSVGYMINPSSFLPIYSTKSQVCI